MHNLITKRGKIFVAGNYPDKNFAMTKEEVEEAVKKFTAPVPLDLNHHKKTLKRLDERLGKLTEVSHDGHGNLFGTVTIPEWLNEVVCKDENGNDLPLPVSCAFAKDKSIVKLALTDTPRVSEAAVFAAFSKAHPEEATDDTVITAGEGSVETDLKTATEAIVNSGVNFGPEAMATFAAEFAKKVRTNEGQMVLQDVHDKLARAGAICSAAEAEFHSEEELSAVQSAHDAVVAGGAMCKILKEGEQPSPYYFNSELSDTADDKNIKENNMDSEKVTLVNRLMAFLSGESSAPAVELSEEKNDKEVETPKVETAAPVKKEETVDFSAKFEAEKTAREAAEAKLEEFQKANIEAQAKVFAGEVISGKHAQESERATIEAAFAQALNDDSANPVEIQFSADSKGSRVDAIRALYGARKVVSLTEETLDEKETETLLSDESKDANADRIAKVKARAKELADRENQRIARLAARK
jgi:hypothetical protein